MYIHLKGEAAGTGGAKLNVNESVWLEKSKLRERKAKKDVFTSSLERSSLAFLDFLLHCMHAVGLRDCHLIVTIQKVRRGRKSAHRQ